MNLKATKDELKECLRNALAKILTEEKTFDKNNKK